MGCPQYDLAVHRNATRETATTPSSFNWIGRLATDQETCGFESRRGHMITLIRSDWRWFCRRWWAHWLNPFTYTRAARWAYQRVTRGYADCDLWSLDHYLNSILVPALTQFKDRAHSYPGELTFEAWKAQLDVMIAGFQAADDLDAGPPDRFFRDNPESTFGIEFFDIEGERAWSEERVAVRELGLATFMKWYGHLWD
jgi:hypothetical protein